MRLAPLTPPILFLLTSCASGGASTRQDHRPGGGLTIVAVGPEAAQAARDVARQPGPQLEIRDGLALLRSRASKRGGDDAPRSDARRVLAQARAAYRELRFDDAISSLARAQNRLAATARAPEEFALLQHLAVQQGLSLLAVKREDEARQAFSTALALGYPGPEPGQYPPDVEARIRGIQDRLAGAPRVGLTIKAQPQGCRLWLDGREHGESPVTLELPPGMHHVRVERVGHRPRAFFHRLSPGKSDRLEVYLKPLDDGELAAQLLRRHRRGEPLVELPASLLARTFGAGVVLLEMQGAQARLRRTARASGPLRPCPGGEPEQLARCIRTRLEGPPGRAPRPTTASPPVYRRWWFWAVVGGGAVAVAGAGVGIYYGTRDRGGTDVDIVSAR